MRELQTELQEVEDELDKEESMLAETTVQLEEIEKQADENERYCSHFRPCLCIKIPKNLVLVYRCPVAAYLRRDPLLNYVIYEHPSNSHKVSQTVSSFCICIKLY